MGRRIAALVLFLGLAGALYAQGGWLILRSPNYQVFSNASENQARAATARLEAMHHLFSQLLVKDKLHDSAPLKVILLRNAAEYQRAVPSSQQGSAGLFIAAQDEQFLVADASARDSVAWQPMLHDYALGLLQANYPATPACFDEGLAQYFAATTINAGDYHLGAPPASAASLTTATWTPLSQLCSSPALADANARAESWLFVRWLLEEHKMPAAGDLFAALAGHTPFAQAVQKAFGISADALDQAVRASLKTPPRTAPVPIIPTESFRHDGLKEWEALALIADFHEHIPNMAAGGLTVLQQVVAAHPESAAAQSALGLALLRAGQSDEATHHLRRATDLGTTDPAPYYWQARQIADSGARDMQTLIDLTQLIDRALVINPAFAYAWDMRAQALANANNPVEAVLSEKSAIRLLPRHLEFQFSLAQYLARSRKYDDSIAVLETLQTSSDAKLAASAAALLPKVQQWKANPSLMDLQQPEATPARDELTDWLARHPERRKEIDALDQAQTGTGEKDEAPKPDPRPTLFLKGMLVRVECGHASAAKPDSSGVLIVSSGGKRYHFTVRDLGNVVVIHGSNIGCDWQNVPVAINYHATTALAGEVVSVEFQPQ